MSAAAVFERLDDGDRRAAMAVTCRHCKARPGASCVVPNVRRHRELAQPHDSRINDGRASRRPPGGGGHF